MRYVEKHKFSTPAVDWRNVLTPKQHFDRFRKANLLYAHLFEHAFRFEDQLAEEHIEDYLINKRVVLGDEKFYLAGLLESDAEGDHIFNPSELPGIPNMQKELETIYYPMLRKISVANMNRHNFLLLRDWSKRRPW